MLQTQTEEKIKVNTLNAMEYMQSKLIEVIDVIVFEAYVEELVARYKLDSLVHFCNTGKFLDEVYFGDKK